MLAIKKELNYTYDELHHGVKNLVCWYNYWACMLHSQEATHTIRYSKPVNKITYFMWPTRGGLECRSLYLTRGRLGHLRRLIAAAVVSVTIVNDHIVLRNVLAV